MTASTKHTAAGSLRPYAVIAGVGYVLLFVLGVFANFFVRESLIVSGDAAATAANITDSIGLFRAGMVAFAAILVIDVIVAWALYVLFKQANAHLSLLTAWFRIVYSVLLGVALVFFFQALQLLQHDAFTDVFTTDQLNAQALVALDTFNSTWLIGLLTFGVHLVLLGLLVVRSGITSRALAAVLMVSGAAYVIDTVAHVLLSNYNDYETLFVTIVAIPSILAEGWFALWLLLRAGRSQDGAHTERS